MRWDNLRIERDSEESAHLPGFRDPATVRRFDAPEAMGIRFYEVEARSAINEVPKKSRMPFRYTINNYRGCTHACVWCFARPTHTYLDMNAREDFEREIVVKVNVPELVRKELRKTSWKGAHVALGTNTDPYQWVEGRYKLMRGIWEAMRDYANPCSVLTKSPLLLRDVDLMKELVEVTDFTAALSIPTLEEKAWRATEPHTPHPRKRIEAVAKLNAAGIPTGVLIAPLQPGINDDPKQVKELVDLCAEAGATHISAIGLHLRGEVKDIWFDWLRENRPDLLPRYQKLYGSRAYLPSAEQKRLSALVRPPKLRRPERPGGRWRRREDQSASEPQAGRPGLAGGAAQPTLF
jgi:DNA repair photolyase